MPNDLVLPVNVATLPSGFCPADYQAMANGFGAIYTVTFPSTFTGVSVSSTKPADTTQAWLQLDSLGRPVRTYFFAQGAWLSMHPTVTGLTQWWFTALPDFTTFDGGDANGIGPASGPMWQQARDANGNIIAAQFPIAAGTLASSTVLAVGDVGGEEKHILTPAEGVDPAHTHVTGRFDKTNDDNALFLEVTSDIGGTGRRVSGDGSFNELDISTLAGNYIGTSGVQNQTAPVGHNNLPPYVVGYLLSRTARIFYSVT